METSLKVDLPQSIRYNPLRIKSKPITLGTIGKTSWSLLPKWGSLGANSKLSFLEVIRTDSQGRFKIEAFLFMIPPQEQANINITKYIENGHTTARLETKWTATFTQYEEIKGNITIRMCAIEDKPNAWPQLSNDFLGLLNNPDSFPDATLICGATEIRVHKSILSARSPVFGAMFKNQMQEGLSSTVEIKDLEVNVLQSTLKYIYSGKTDHVSNALAGDLLFAADKYQLKDLKSICVGKLKSSMKEKNVFRILVLGHLHDRGLKDTATEFICKCNRFSDMEMTEYWNLLKTQYPHLAIDVLTSVVKYLQSK